MSDEKINHTRKNSRQRRKLDQIDKWKKSVYGSWQTGSQKCTCKVFL